MVEKSCEKCGGGDVAHRVQHVLRRLPRVLVLHLKRFQVPSSDVLDGSHKIGQLPISSNESSQECGKATKLVSELLVSLGRLVSQPVTKSCVQADRIAHHI